MHTKIKSKILLKCFLIFILSLAYCQVALAKTPVQPGAIRLEEVRNLPALPNAIPDDLAEEPSDEERRKGEFIVAPLPSRSPLLGWQLTLPAMYLYKPSFSQAEDSVWVTGAMGFYSESDSWGAGVFHKMSTGGDLWRYLGAGVTADINYDFFGIGGEPDLAIPLSQEISFLLVEALRRVHNNWYVGLRGSVSSTSVSLDIPEDLLPPGAMPPDLSRDFDLVTLAPRVQYDTRDNPFYPREGAILEGTASLGLDALGSDAEYEKYSLAYNHYWSVGDASVLAFRTMFEYAAGDAPFFLFPAFGQGADLRGYQTGTYRDRFMFATQAEYRWRFAERWGAVGFAGIGTVDGDFAGWGDSLASAGVGLRWVIAPKNNMSLRFDIARGRDDTEFYVGIGEAF